MRAVLVKQPGGVEALELCELPQPRPGPREVLVRNFATALNRADLLQRRGLYPPPPGDSEVLGLEFAGEVAECGSDAKLYRRGDRVFGLTGGGGYGEFLCADERLAVPIPDNLSYDAAAAVPEVFYTAHETLFTLGGLAAGQCLLVHAGASGVGTAAIQLARAAGARTFATAGSPEKLRLCVELGAERALNYREGDFAPAVLELTGNRGVDVVLDLVGAKYWEQNLRSLRDGGRLLVVGLLGGAKVTADLWLLLRRRLHVIGSALRGRSLEDKIALTRRFREQVLPLIERGEVRPVIDRVFPLDEVRQAHERMEANLNLGKIVLRL
jgi:putative PIG3 family NAD(P)H quinone oxidoreductase